MKTIYATNPVDVLHLGKQGEYGNTQVYFPATGLSDCTVIILNKRCGETYPYACMGEFVVKNGKHFFVWSIGSAETCKPGKGAVEINFYFDNILQKSATYTTYVSMSVENSEDYVPVAMQTWVGMMMQNTAQSLKYFTDCQKFYEDCKKLRDEIFTFDAGDESNDLVNTLNKVFAALDEVEGKIENIADKEYVENAVSSKADKEEMAEELLKKADASTVIAELAKKADTEAVQADLNDKVSKDTLDEKLADKADKAAIQTALNEKVSNETFSQEIDKKADKETLDEVVEQLSEKASQNDLEAVEQAVEKKANQTTVDAIAGRLLEKADASVVNDALNTKASKDYVDGVLHAKADKLTVDTELDKKADKLTVDTELDKKADKDYVENSLSALQGKLKAGFGITISETNTISVSLGMAEGVGF